jgi:DNA-binding transcriptional MerR regulator
MNHFTISDIENLTRIKAHTLRVWEKRYHLISPKRTESGHRFFDGEDLKTMLRIAWLYDNGHKISQIAKLSQDEMRNRALGFDDKEIGPEQFLNTLMEASIDLNHELLNKTLGDAADQLGFEKMILKVAFPFLKKIGLLWLTGHLIPAQEHFASSIISHKIIAETDRLPPAAVPMEKRTVLLFSPPGEHHELPLLFVQYLLRKNGIPTYYFGPGIKSSLLREFCSEKKVHEVYFHLITNLTRIDLYSYLNELSELLPQQRIYFSGIRPGVEKRLPERVTYLDNNESIMKYIGQ